VVSTVAERAVRQSRKEPLMGTDDKLDAKADEITGKTKEAAGRVTDNPDLEAEGRSRLDEAVPKGEQLLQCKCCDGTSRCGVGRCHHEEGNACVSAALVGEQQYGQAG
jgi:uncharacterized protein YjbJ (UPF0337 family)